MEIAPRYIKRTPSAEKERRNFQKNSLLKIWQTGEKTFGSNTFVNASTGFDRVQNIRLTTSRKRSEKKKILDDESSLSSADVYGSETERGMQLDRRLAISRTVDEGNGVWVLEKFYRFVKV